ncbi:MAG: hypothetical protein K2N38_14460 [Oscillospiraceae bacterium]|nr:hypothetical protein [Oscillospiraceae bacterium]
MLNEKITITVCGKNYKLVTDNSAMLVEAARDLDRRITEYCRSGSDWGKEDAAVFAALDCTNEVAELNAKCKALTAEVNRLKTGEEAAKNAIAENKALKEENIALGKSKEELDKLSKRFSELEGKNAQLAETLKDANAKAAECASLKKDIETAKKTAESLEAKNAQLSQSAKDGAAKLDEQKKLISERDKRIAELEKEQAKAVNIGEENKRLAEKLAKAENFEEAYRREERRADAAEKERDALMTAKEQLNKSVAEYRSQIEQLTDKAKAQSGENEKKLRSELEKATAEMEKLAKDYEELMSAYDELDSAGEILEKKVAELDELKVRYSQVESENAALKQAEGGSEELRRQLDEMKQQLDELKLKNAELDKDNKSLRKTNSSLDKQLKEMLEDGQLTL